MRQSSALVVLIICESCHKIPGIRNLKENDLVTRSCYLLRQQYPQPFRCRLAINFAGCDRQRQFLPFRPVRLRFNPVQTKKHDTRAQRRSFVPVNKRVIPAKIKEIGRRNLREIGVIQYDQELVEMFSLPKGSRIAQTAQNIYRAYTEQVKTAFRKGLDGQPTTAADVDGSCNAIFNTR